MPRTGVRAWRTRLKEACWAPGLEALSGRVTLARGVVRSSSVAILADIGGNLSVDLLVDPLVEVLFHLITLLGRKPSSGDRLVDACRHLVLDGVGYGTRVDVVRSRYVRQ